MTEHSTSEVNEAKLDSATVCALDIISTCLVLAMDPTLFATSGRISDRAKGCEAAKGLVDVCSSGNHTLMRHCQFHAS